MAWKSKTLKKTVITVISYGLEVKNIEKDCYYCYFVWFGKKKPRKRLLLLLFYMVWKEETMKKTVITVILYGLEVKNLEKDCYYCYFVWFGRKTKQTNSYDCHLR